jgi:uncharacterized protein involved in exopolysaccharide biosynthesis
MLDRPSVTPQALNGSRRDHQPARMPVEGAEPTALNAATGLAILRRRKWLFLASLLLVPLVTFIAICQVTPLYTAKGTLLYDSSEYKLR